MKMHKRRVRACCLWLGICLLLFCGCGKQEQKLRLGVSMPTATHGWAGGVVWCAEQAKERLQAEHPDLEIFLAASPDAARQAEQIENLLVRDIDALVVMAQEPGPITKVCQRAKEQGVYLVVVSNPLEERCEDVFVNGDNRSFGWAAGEAIGEILGGEGTVLVLEGIPCPINTERVSGFNQVLAEKFPRIRILDSQPAWWNAEKGLSLMENFLLKYPQVDAVWAGDDDVLTGALKAYQESGRKDVRAFVGGGGSKNVVKRIIEADPLVKATVTYPPEMLAVGMDAAVERLKNIQQPRDDKREIIIKSQIITTSNGAEFYFPDSVY
ncbi:MAG: substrate-binding domain-containing protein [Lentisphaerae bacterium]|nr:substrate-binding domain-containing protein [Lentisphaerota bacterium]